jgi:hypothetical protein
MIALGVRTQGRKGGCPGERLNDAAACIVSHTGPCSAAPGASSVVCTGNEKRTRSRVLQAEARHCRFFRRAGFGSKGAAGIRAWEPMSGDSSSGLRTAPFLRSRLGRGCPSHAPEADDPLKSKAPEKVKKKHPYKTGSLPGRWL